MVTKGPWEQRVVFDQPRASPSAPPPGSLAQTGNHDTSRDEQHEHARACRECAKSKVKCIPNGDQITPCQRCSRLNRECIINPKAPKRLRKQTSTRLAQLEQKLDGLVGMLAPPTQQQPVERPIEAVQQPLFPSRTVPQFTANGLEVAFTTAGAASNDSASQHTPIAAPPPAEGTMKETSPLSFDNSIPEFAPGFAQAPALLHRFRRQQTPHFPFVVVPQTMSVDRLRAEKPFLFRAIVVVAGYDDLVRQRRLAQEAIKYFSEHLIVKGEKTLDLLQGALVITAWYHLHLMVNQQVTNLVYLSTALVADLCLSKAPTAAPNQPGLVNINKDYPFELPAQTARSSEEQRALLGCFYLFSMLSRSLRVETPLHFSPYMKETCDSLAEAKECDTDALLVGMVRVQQIVDEIEKHTASKPSGIHSGNASTSQMTLYVQSFQKDIQSLRQSLPEHVKSNVILQVHFAAAELKLFDRVMRFLKNPATTPNSTPSHPLEALDLLHGCLLAVRRLFDAFLAIEPADFYDTTITLWAICTLAFLIIFKLHAMEADNWTTSHIRSIVDLPTTFDALASRLTEAQAAAGVRDNDIFVKFVKRLQQTRDWFESTVVQYGGRWLVHPEGGNVDIAARIEDTYYIGAAGKLPFPAEDQNALFDSFEGDFWKDFLGDWDGSLEGMGI